MLGVASLFRDPESAIRSCVRWLSPTSRISKHQMPSACAASGRLKPTKQRSLTVRHVPGSHAPGGQSFVERQKHVVIGVNGSVHFLTGATDGSRRADGTHNSRKSTKPRIFATIPIAAYNPETVHQQPSAAPTSIAIARVQGTATSILHRIL